MANAHVHSVSSVRKWGGKVEDYMPIHEFMDSSKGAFSSNHHRACFHHSFGASVIIPKCFGYTITNSDGKIVSTKDIAERHILEDFGQKFIPTLQDYLENMSPQDWMNNGIGAPPNSARKIYEAREAGTTKVTNINID